MRMTKAKAASRRDTWIKCSSKDSVAWLIDTGVFEDFVDSDTIHNIPLLIEIIDEKGLVKTGVFLCFSERKAFAMETDQYVTEWPLFDWFLMNRRFGKNDNADEFVLLQSAQDFFHRFSFDFLPLGTDADCDKTTILLQKITDVQGTNGRRNYFGVVQCNEIIEKIVSFITIDRFTTAFIMLNIGVVFTHLSFARLLRLERERAKENRFCDLFWFLLFARG